MATRCSRGRARVNNPPLDRFRIFKPSSSERNSPRTAAFPPVLPDVWQSFWSVTSCWALSNARTLPSPRRLKAVTTSLLPLLSSSQFWRRRRGGVAWTRCPTCTVPSSSAPDWLPSGSQAAPRKGPPFARSSPPEKYQELCHFSCLGPLSSHPSSGSKVSR